MPAGPLRLVLLHGFTQTGRSWEQVVAPWRASAQVVLPDLPGHGTGGPARPLSEAALDLAARHGPAVWIGYSLGGRHALEVALARPDVVEALVLVGATAGLEDPSERSARRSSDDALARSLEHHGLEAFLDRWLALPLFAGLPPERAGREERLGNTVDGLAGSLRLAGTGTQEPSWHRLGTLTMPVLVLAGAEDHKFSELGRRLSAGIGAGARFETVPGAGHSAHLEQPEAFRAAVERFLAAVRPPGLR